MTRKTLTIDVRREDIATGVRRNPSKCPVARATSRRLHGAAVEANFEEIDANGRIFDISSSS